MPTSSQPISRGFKDSVFTHLFAQSKYLLELYQELHPEDVDATESDLHTITLQNIMVNAPYNDLGFTVRDRLVILVEAQSTWSPNIVVRALLYFARTLENWFDARETNLYAARRVELPTPELYVVYTGTGHNVPDELSLSLDFFSGHSTDIDAHIHVFRGGGTGIVSQYVEFAQIGDDAFRKSGRTREAAREVIDQCIQRGILVDYLQARKREVEDVMLKLYDEEEVIRRYALDAARDAMAKGLEEGLEKGLEKGLQQGRERGLEEGRERGLRQGVEQGIAQSSRDIARRMLNRGMDPASVAELCGLTAGEVAELARDGKGD